MSNKHKKYAIFECTFGLSLNLVATMVVSSIKMAYPDREIVVVSNFPEVWLHNPDVYRVYKIGFLQYFFDDFIDQKDTLIFKHNPILTEDYIHNKKHIAKIWCDLYGIRLTTDKPKLFFTFREKEALSKITASDKPKLFIESNASSYDYGHSLHQNNSNRNNWIDNIPLFIMNQIIEKMTKKGFDIIDISENPITINTKHIKLGLRLKFCAIIYSDTRLFVNSFAQHISANLGLSSVVAWTSALPQVWGYTLNKNIVAKDSHKITQYLKQAKTELRLSPQKQCLYDLSGIFDVDLICKELENIYKKSKK